MDSPIDAATAVLPPHVRDELTRNVENGCIGQRLVAETERVRVWMIHLPPGQRLPMHRHVKDYFWLALTDGRARSHILTNQGLQLDEFELTAGATKYNKYGPGEFKFHDLENTGHTELVFATVEFRDSPNEFLPVPDSVRRPGSDGVISSTKLG